ncbi:MAG TPA: nucleoside hydrolase [Solirubrobacteraceae bacterium]
MILDVDTGTDDAVAIMLAALHPDLDLIGVTTVNGNVEVRYCTDNTLRTLDFVGRSDIPVFEGVARPLVRPDFPTPRAIKKSTGVHGLSLDIPDPTSTKQSRSAVEFLIETYRSATDEITLVPTGPLTNIAAAVALDPGFVDRVPEVVIMGGAHHHGNVTPAAEFNIWADPEAAHRVFTSGIDLTMVGLDVTHQALLRPADVDRLRVAGKAGKLVADLFSFYVGFHRSRYGWDAAPVHDAVAVAHVIDGGLLGTEHAGVVVDTGGELSRGRTYVDLRGATEWERNCHVALRIDADRFRELLLTRISSLG